MTTLTERAAARCNRPGRPTSGPMAEMMARAGFSAGQIVRAGESLRRNFLEPGAIGGGVVAEADVLRFVAEFSDLARAMNIDELGDDEFVVEVDVTDRTVAAGAFVVETFRFVLLAPNHHEARLIAFQWTIWLVDELCTGDRMIVATRITD